MQQGPGLAPSPIPVMALTDTGMGEEPGAAGGRRGKLELPAFILEKGKMSGYSAWNHCLLGV